MTSQMHTDHDKNATSIIYHAFGESGDTVFEDGSKVCFRKGRMIVFDSKIKHMGKPPKSGMRISLGVIAPHRVQMQEGVVSLFGGT